MSRTFLPRTVHFPDILISWLSNLARASRSSQEWILTHAITVAALKSNHVGGAGPKLRDKVALHQADS